MSNPWPANRPFARAANSGKFCTPSKTMTFNAVIQIALELIGKAGADPRLLLRHYILTNYLVN